MKFAKDLCALCFFFRAEIHVRGE